MTRLTPTMIQDVPSSLGSRDADLRGSIGTDLLGLARAAARAGEDAFGLSSMTAAVVPVTSGQGVTRGFTTSVQAIISHLGASAWQTERTDVSGFHDAVRSGADLIFMADDGEFVAYNRRHGGCVTNVECTALGYVTALEIAAGGLRGREVAVIGAGRVGSHAVRLLAERGASVFVHDADRAKAEMLAASHGAVAVGTMAEALRSRTLALNASPAPVPGGLIARGTIMSSPGMPFSFDEEGMSRMGRLIHDPLQIGVATMAVSAAGLGARDGERAA